MTDWLRESIAERARERQQQERTALLAAPDVTPDYAAETWQQGQEQGLEPGLAFANPDDVRQEAERRRLDRVTQRDPVLGDWLAARPERLAVARDDLENLSHFDGVLGTALGSLPFVGRDAVRGYDESVSPVRQRLSERFTIAAVQQSAGAVQAGSEFIERSVVQGFGNAMAEIFDVAARQAQEGDQYDAEVAEALGRTAAIFRSDLFGLRSAAEDAAGVIEASTEDRERLAGFAQRPSGVGDALMRPGNAIEYYGGILTESLPSILLAMGTRRPGAAAGVVGGSSGAMQYGTSRMEGIEPFQAAGEALTAGAIETVLSRTPFDIAFGSGPFGRRLALATGAESVTEGATTASQIVTQDAWRGEETPVREAMLEVLDAVIVGGGSGFIQSVLGTRIEDIQSFLRNVDESAMDAARLQAIHQAAEQVRTLDRTPGEVEALVRSIVDRGDGLAQSIYMDAGALQTFYQSQALDAAAEIAELTGDPHAYETALASGGDVVIPVERYVTRATRSPHAEALRDMARLAPDRASNAELRDLDVDAVFANMEAAPVRTDAPADPTQQVATRVRDQLEQAGVEATAAAAMAQQTAQRYATRAERRGLGETALQVFEASGLQIRRGEPGASQELQFEQSPTPPVTNAVPAETEIEQLRRRVLELETELRTDPMTGLANQRAFDEDASLTWPAVAAADMDGLKRLNDSIGHEAGDQVLRTLGAVLMNAQTDGVKFYRRSGDEFAARFADPAQAEAIMADLQQRLESVNVEIDVTAADGSVRSYVYEGVGLTFGLGDSYAVADTAANQSKQARLEAGLREDARATGTPRRVRDVTGDPARSDRDGARGESDGLTLEQADGTGPIPRGRILIGRDGTNIIELLEGADLTTFHHESAHLFFEELVADAFTDGTPAQLRQDLDTVLEWMDASARSEDGLAAVREAIGRDQHEQFARGYEAYLFQGKAPSSTLADLYARFRAWMVSTYRQLRALNVELTDDVTGVYDRLIATDDEIATAQFRQGFDTLPIPEDVRGMLTPRQWETYEASMRDAETEARQSVEQRLLAAQRREAEAWWNEQRTVVQAEVQAEAMTRPELVAITVLSRGRMPDGSEATGQLADLRLNRDDLVDSYGERWVVDNLNPKRVYRRTGGESASVVAAALGFPDGGALVQALVQAPASVRQWIDTETDRRMRERHPDPLLDGTLPAQAMDAVHNNKRLQAIEAELAILSQVASEPTMPPRLLGAAARQRIAAMKRRDVRPNDYLVAERKAARRATQQAAAGRYAEALQAKRQQALNAHLYRAAMDATADFDKARDYLRRLTRKDKRAELGKAGGQYLEQVDGLLELVELRNVSAAEVSRRAALADWVERRAAEGESIDVPDSVLAMTQVTNLRDMSMEHIRGLVDTVRQIEHLAKLKTKLMLGREMRDRAEVDQEMAASVLAAREKRPENTGDRTIGEKVRMALNEGRAAYLRPSTITRDLDGFVDSGAVWTHTVGVAQDAINNQLNPALLQAQEAISDIWLKHYSQAELRKMSKAVYREEAGAAWSHGRLLALALNWGNQGNREAILSQSRRRLTPEQAGQLMGRLDARDWAFVQDVWRYVDSFWPQIAETTRRRTGLTPEKVEASPFRVRTADGQDIEISGGYYPLKFESARDPKASQDELGDYWDSVRTGRFSKAQTKNGHTKERVGSGGREVMLDMSVLGGHINDVLRDIHVGDAVNYVSKVLKGAEFRSALADVGKLEYGKALELWLRDVAIGEQAPRTFIERIGKRVRQNFSASLLGFNFATAAIQPTGFFQTGALLGWDVLQTGTKRFLTRPWIGESSIFDEVDRVSPMMMERAQTSVEAVRLVQRGLAGKRDSFIMRHAWWMMARTQRIVDMVTWLGAEAKGMDMFDGDLQRARRFADDAVQRSQASGQLHDKSALERGTFGDNIQQSEMLRMTTVLMSYMIAKGNGAYEQTRKTEFQDPAQIGKWVINMGSLFVLEGMLIAALRGGHPDDEAEWDEWAWWVASRGGLEMIGTIPVVGQFGSELRGYTSQSPSARLFGQAADVFGQGERVIEGEGNARTAAKVAVWMAGSITGFPSAQTNRTMDALWDAYEGEEVTPWDAVHGKRRD